ncbi:hypothetical protein JCM8097_000268 [Rhodosporidiobolus ruineniae]
MAATAGKLAGAYSRLEAFTGAVRQLSRSHPDDGPFPRPTPQLSNSVFDLFSMKGKVTLITGGAGGIGFAVAEAVAEAGGDVALLYNSSEAKAKAGAEDLEKRYGVKARAFKCQVTDRLSIEEAVDAVATEFGRIDVAVANAGGGVPGSINENYKPEDWEFTMNINLNHTFWLARAVEKHFRKHGNGSFIATTSISARIVNVPYDQAAYNSSKAGVVHFVKSIARDWRGFARANCISPGFFDTPMGPSDEKVHEVVHRLSVFGRMGQVRELKGAYLYLASNASSYTTGTDVLVDGGYTLT